jgi:predicted amidohydrolase
MTGVRPNAQSCTSISAYRLGPRRRAPGRGLTLAAAPPYRAECFLQGYLVTGRHVRNQAFATRSTGFAAVVTWLAGIRQTLVFGMIERSGSAFYNTAVVVTGGRVVGGYRKTFLTEAESVFTAGDAYPVYARGGVRFGINICYDTQSPQAAAAVPRARCRCCWCRRRT